MDDLEMDVVKSLESLNEEIRDTLPWTTPTPGSFAHDHSHFYVDEAVCTRPASEPPGLSLDNCQLLLLGKADSPTSSQGSQDMTKPR